MKSAIELQVLKAVQDTVDPEVKVATVQDIVEKVLPPILSPFLESIANMMTKSIDEKFAIVESMIMASERKMQENRATMSTQQVQMASLAGHLATVREHNPGGKSAKKSKR